MYILPMYINIYAVNDNRGRLYLTDWLYLTGRNFIIIVPAGQTVWRCFWNVFGQRYFQNFIF
ncbi:hypothetical protein HMPREF1548_04304 [Clostridium sp. KLE 1755]|nr:hypothetical protein HMPREF1548_04304 [Clostridium sp. KLE 1755]